MINRSGAKTYPGIGTGENTARTPPDLRGGTGRPEGGAGESPAQRLERLYRKALERGVDPELARQVYDQELKKVGAGNP